MKQPVLMCNFHSSWAMCSNSSNSVSFFTIAVYFVSFIFWFAVANAPLSLTVDADSLKDVTFDIYDVTKKFSNLSPNLGMYWYFFVNAFERFLPYFTTISSSLLFMFVVPVIIRFYNYPLPMVRNLISKERVCN